MESEKGRSWYDTGYDGMRKEQDRIDQMSGPRRMWMPPDTSKEIVFLDDDPFCIYEHNPKIGGSWKNWLTCLKGISDNPPCCDKLGERSRYYVGYYTVVDCSEWKDKKGNVYQYELKLLPAKLKTMKKIKRKKEARGSLVGCMFTTTREDKKSPVVGDEFEFKREVDLVKLFQVANFHNKKLPELFAKVTGNADNLERLKRTFQVHVGSDGVVEQKLVPFNYLALLEPMSPASARDFVGGAVESSGGESDGEETGEGAKVDEKEAF